MIIQLTWDIRGFTVTFHYLVVTFWKHYGHVSLWNFPLVEPGFSLKSPITVTFLVIDAQGVGLTKIIAVTFHFFEGLVLTITVTFLPIDAQGVG